MLSTLGITYGNENIKHITHIHTRATFNIRQTDRETDRERERERDMLDLPQ